MKEIVLVLKEDLKKEFLKHWKIEDSEKFKKGCEFSALESDFDNPDCNHGIVNEGDGYSCPRIIIESNMYWANFPVSEFKKK